jgi:hypothetical protein
VSDETTFGRAPVQIVELIQPKCGNVHGTAPCMSTQTGDGKCFNTRATCRDPSNYRGSPSGHLTSDLSLDQGDAVTSTDLTRTAALFAKFDIEFTDDPSGVIWEMGGSSTGVYLGITSGNLVFRAGDGGSGTPSNCAKVSVAIGDLAEKQVQLYCAINTTSNSVSVWSYDPITRVVSLVGTDTAVGSFTFWAGSGAGGIGFADGTVPTGEDSDDFDGVINSADFYDSTASPDMDATFALNLFFSQGHVAEQDIDGAPYIIPLLKSVSTAPSQINIAGSDSNAQGLGTRALCSMSMADAPYNDLKVDPYLSDRTYTPLDRGTFWTKWMARNKYRSGIVQRVYEGYEGQALADMRMRQYFLDSVSGPKASSGFNISGKDILAKVEDRKAQVPAASPGELYEDIDDTETAIEVAGAELSEYSSSGTLRIGDELMTYSSVATSTNGITFTITARGADDTTADSHSAEDGVQECLRYTDELPHVIVRDLLTRSGVSYSFIDWANWVDEVNEYLSSYLLTTIISEPTSVQTLLSELQEQALFNVWWDEYSQLIKFKAVRAVVEEPPTVTEESNILAGSFSITEQPKQRASQVWISYAPELWTGDLDSASDFKNTYVTADLQSESDDEYGEASVRKVYSRWLQTGTLAFNTGSKIITRYAETPRQAVLSMDAKDRATYGVGDAFKISHHLDVTDTGENNLAIWTVTSVEETSYGRTVQYTVEDTTAFGRTYVIQAPGAADYDPATTYTNEAFIGDADGLLSDGTECARIT